ERHVFLDIQHDQAYIRRMWSSAISHAKQHGYVVVIGHIWSKHSAGAIRDSYETLQNQGYSFHLLSELYT
ncbi:MAG: divergent polysaccharide deacetylase family protein, partial [Kiritimatiellaceae bacterium]|nr:divergent polysaccharide deacetylase family protein [Kiritimatiellaceae bacterium]